MSRLYKIISREDWEAAQQKGVLEGAGIDLRDGYIHLSTADQTPETLRLHFAGRTDLIILQLESSQFGDELKWEEARGGQQFPHLYAPLDVSKVLKCEMLPLGPDGVPAPAAPLSS